MATWAWMPLIVNCEVEASTCFISYKIDNITFHHNLVSFGMGKFNKCRNQKRQTDIPKTNCGNIETECEELWIATNHLKREKTKLQFIEYIRWKRYVVVNVLSWAVSMSKSKYKNPLEIFTSKENEWETNIWRSKKGKFSITEQKLKLMWKFGWKHVDILIWRLINMKNCLFSTNSFSAMIFKSTNGRKFYQQKKIIHIAIIMQKLRASDFRILITLLISF